MEFNMNEAEAEPSDNLYISDLPSGTTEDSLRGMFGPGVVQCRVLPSKRPGQDSCVALVRFSSVKEATLVRETLNGAIPPGQQRPVSIRFCGKAAALGGASNAPSYTKAAMGGGAARPSPYGGFITPGGPAAAAPAEMAASPYAGGYSSMGGCAMQSDKQSPQPSDNLYITGLPPGIDNASLLGLFSQYGQVVQCKVLPVQTEGACPHALVRFSSIEESAAVKKALTGYALEGVNEPLVVEFAVQKPMTEGCGGKGGMDPSCGKGCGKGDDWGCKGGGKGKDGTQGPPPWGSMDQILQGFLEAACLPGHELGNEDNCLFISGLPKDCDDVHLYRLLAPFGAITPTGVKAMKYPDGTCKGFGFVNFVDPSALQAAAMMLHGTQLPDGSTMSVVPKRNKAAKGKGKEGTAAPASEGDQNALS